MSETQRFTSNIIAKDSAKVNGGAGGGGGTSSYADLTNKPSINGVQLSGNKTAHDLGIDVPTKTSELQNDSGFTSSYSDLSNKPSINGVALTGNKTAHDLGIDVPTKTSDLQNDSGFLSAVPTASANTIGGVKVGSGLSIDESGVLSAQGGGGGGATITPFTLEVAVMPVLGTTGSIQTYGKYLSSVLRSIVGIKENFNSANYPNTFIRVMNSKSFSNVIYNKVSNLTDQDFQKLDNLLRNSILGLKYTSFGSAFVADDNGTALTPETIHETQTMPCVDGKILGGGYDVGSSYSLRLFEETGYTSSGENTLALQVDTWATPNAIARIMTPIAFIVNGDYSSETFGYDTTDIASFDANNYSTDNLLMMQFEGYCFGDNII